MTFIGKDRVERKIIIDNQTIEQVANFNSSECDITYEENKYILNKADNYRRICGIIGQTLKEETMRRTQMYFFFIKCRQGLLGYMDRIMGL